MTEVGKRLFIILKPFEFVVNSVLLFGPFDIKPCDGYPKNLYNLTCIH